MITKRGLAEQLISILYPNPTEDVKLHSGEAELIISQARDEYVRNLVLSQKSETSVISGNLLSSFDGQPILYNDSRCEYYCYLPARVITLPNDLGLNRVLICGDENKDVVITPSGFNNMYANSAAKNLGEISGYLKQNKFIFNDKIDRDKYTVSFDLLAMSQDIGSDDYFPIDDSALPQILARAIDILRIQKGIPEDTRNDNISQ